MRILRNYILKELFGFFFLALGLLTFVMLIGNLVRVVNLILNKGADPLQILKLFLYLIPYLLTYTIPIAFLSAILFALGRLSSDNEITAIQASGINIISLIIPILILGTILGLFLFILNDSIIPYAHFASRRALTEIGMKNPAAFLEPAVFITAFQDYIIFIYHIEGNKLFNIRIYQPQPNNRPARTIIAKRGEFVSNPEKSIIKLKLEDGSSDEPDPENPYNFYKLNFKTYFLTLNLLPNIKNLKQDKKPKDMNFKELRKEIERMKRIGIDPTPLLSHLHERIALSFSCFIFCIVGAPLALITRRRERTINLGIVVIIAGTYYLLLLAAETLAITGRFPPVFATWLPNIILGIIGISLLYRICGY